MSNERSEKIVRALVAVCAVLWVVAVSWVAAGCQTRVTIERCPETAHPLHQVVTVDGEEQLAVIGYLVTSGGWCFSARSPLWAKEQFAGLRARVETNGVFVAELDAYDRDLSTNAVVMTKTIFDGSANLAQAVARAYATISTGGASDSLVARVVDFFRSRGGDPSRSAVISDGSKIKVTDGATCIECDAQGSCSDCSVR